MRECGDPVLDLPHPVLRRDDAAAGRRARALPRRARGRRGVRLAAARASGTGSNHGYDVVDPTRISGERGGEEGRRALVAAVRARGMGFLLDIVPNHVGVDVAAGEPVVVGRAHARPRRRGTRRTSTSTGRRPDRCWSSVPSRRATRRRCSSEVTLAETTGAALRYYEHAFPVAPGTRRATGTAQEVHARQHYRLTSWKRGAAELTYRRFFDVSTLAAVRVEDPEVFAATHGEVLRWVEAGDVDGLRVDHPDGLSDPGGYARRLRAAIGPDRWLLVEKILGVGEELPVSWPVDGTSGYEALREICGVFVDADGAGLLTQLTAEHLGRRENAHAVEHAARREVTDTILAAEVRRIAALVPVAPTDDGPGPAAEEAVAELLCGFPVYRSYLPEGRSALETAVSVARAHRPDLAEVLATIRDTMLADPDGELATRVQQTSGMVMAKGVEDTAFYRYNRLVALNEVGGDPDRFGVSPAEFHDRNAGRVASWPRTMTTLSTHDTKRSEDVRARLAVLAEIPDEWAPRFRRWAAAHPLPDRSLDLLAWQNLVGAWPISAERLAAYLGKASREAKLVTSHVDPNAEVDAAVAAWPEQVLGDAGIVAEVAEFVARIDEPGRSNSLGQKLLQIAGPGVPDVYQGTELYEYSLVDPDNRRPVDWELRRQLLARIDGGWLPEFAERIDSVASTRRARRSCWSRHRRCSCAGSDRSCSPGTGPSRPRGRRRSTRSRSPGRRSSWRWRPGCRSGSPLAAAGRTPCCRCRTAPRPGRTCSPARPSGAAPPGSHRCWRATRSRCWCGRTLAHRTTGRHPVHNLGADPATRVRPAGARPRVTTVTPRPTRRSRVRPGGPGPTGQDCPVAEFAVWAPLKKRVRVLVDNREHDMLEESGGWWRADVPDVGAGAAYSFLLDDDETPLPDPRSLWLPSGVHSASRLYDHDAFFWSDHSWTGRQLPGSVLYELHIGTFTEGGTFDSAIERLDHLVALGIDLVEVLPVNAVDGDRNWGYDGVGWYAVTENYGGPDAFKRFVDACHARGLGRRPRRRLQPHGPVGRLPRPVRPLLRGQHRRGAPPSTSTAPHSEQVRRYVIDNALMWLRDYHLDGLRLDAVHALHDRRAVHLLEQMTIEVEALSTHLGRPLSLIAESDLNDARMVTSRDGGGYGLHAQWADDVHHSLHVAAHRRGPGLLRRLRDRGADRARPRHDPGVPARGHLEQLPRPQPRRPGRHPPDPGAPVHHLRAGPRPGREPGGRRPAARRRSPRGSSRAVRHCCSAHRSRPMLFMGEEWGARTPWQFFSHFPDDRLNDAVRQGRRSEFASHGWDAAEEVPDPTDVQTFLESKLDWTEPTEEPHATVLATYRELIALRKARPELSDPWLDEVDVDVDEDARTIVLHRGAPAAGGQPRRRPGDVRPGPADRPGAAGVGARAHRRRGADAEPGVVRDRRAGREARSAPLTGPVLVPCQRSPSPFTASRSSASSATEASILPRENASSSRPWTISQRPPVDTTGNDGDQALGDAVRAVRHDGGRGPVALGRAVDPVADVVDRRVRGRRRGRRPAGLDDRRAALGDRRDELVAQPALLDLLRGDLAADLGVEQVRVLGGRVVAPDRHLA